MAMESDIYAQNWQIALVAAEKAGLRVIEHGWEQHVIIDEPNLVVYRYPRHESAAAKLADEVAVLHDIHTREWPVELPVMIEHTDVYTSYRYIVGEILNEEQIATLTDQNFEEIGRKLGETLALIHQLPHQIIEQKQTKQTMTLLQYYTDRIEKAHGDENYSHAIEQLNELKKRTNGDSVVVHGDLHGYNIVIDPVSKALNGIIDLSEMEVGNPHQDFRKLFMTDPRLLRPAAKEYEKNGSKIDLDTVKLWAYVNEWANVCYFADEKDNPTYERAVHHLSKWGQLPNQSSLPL